LVNNLTVAEGTLAKLGVHVWDLKKLLIGSAQSSSRPVWKQSVIKVSSLACSQGFISKLKRGVPLCRKSAEPKPIFFGKWVELMNIYVARKLCMT